MLGIVGGAIFTLAIAISSAQLTSSAHYISSCCYGFTSNRLLILDGIMLQLCQKSAHTNDLFFTPKIFYTQQFSRPAFQNVPTQTPKHSTRWSTTTYYYDIYYFGVGYWLGFNVCPYISSG